MYNSTAIEHNNHGVDRKEKGDIEGAIREYQTAISIEPRFVEAINALGAALARSQRLDEAIDCFNRALQIRPDFQPARHNLRKATIDRALARGIELAETGMSADAEAVFSDIIRNFPDDPAAYVNLARMYAERGETERAISLIEKALEITPNNAVALNNLGVELQQLGRSDRAEQCDRKAIAADSNYAEPHNNLGTLFLKKGDLQRAAEHFRAALRIDPDYESPKKNLASLERKEIPQMATNQPVDIKKRAGRAAALAQAGNLGAAEAEFTEILRLAPSDPDAHFNLGLVYTMKGELQKAIERYESAVRLNPKYSKAWNNMGSAFQRLGRLDHATQCYRQAVESDPTNAEAHNSFGALLLEAAIGEIPREAVGGGAFIELLLKAAQHFETALKLKPNYEKARQNLEEVNGLLAPSRNSIRPARKSKPKPWWKLR